MSLNSMLDAAARGGTVEVEDGWTQGRAIYGGLTGALLLAGFGAGLHPLLQESGAGLVMIVSGVALVGSAAFPLVLAELAAKDKPQG